MSKASAQRGSGVSRYLQEIREYRPLTREAEQEVARRADAPAACGEAFQDLVKANLGFVVKLAGEYRHLGLPFEDLLNEGNVGLIEAARRFDPTHGAKFITYATWWIRKSMLKAISRNATIVHVPEYQLRQAREARETRRMLARALGRDAGREEISREMRVTVARLETILQGQVRDRSLDEPVGEDQETTYLDQLVDDRSVDPEEELIRHEIRGRLRRSLLVLSRRQRSVLIDRFGLSGGRRHTLREIGDRLGMTREGVRQMVNQATKRLRRVMGRRRSLEPRVRQVL
jgi:RNA polymerase primary sigma factor